jgi:hypothetical protein
MFGLAFSAADAQSDRSPSFQPKEGFVPNAKTAVKVAEAVLAPVYGEEQIASERPFKAVLQGDIWTVTGTLQCALPNRCNGGTAGVKISKTSGQILHMTHGK